MANVKLAYEASSQLTITLADLPTSSTLLVGRQSTTVSNTTTLADDYLIGGVITLGTSPTAGFIEVWAFGSLNDTPLYPDAFAGTDAARTVTSDNIKFSVLALLARMATATVSDRPHHFGPISLTRALHMLGASMAFPPKNFGVFVTHNTVVNLNATPGNHGIYVTPIYHTV